MSNRYTDVETITPEQRLQLIALFTLGQSYIRQLREVEKAAIAITGDEEYGHTGDELWHDYPDVDALLNRLAITVEASTVQAGWDLDSLTEYRRQAEQLIHELEMEVERLRGNENL